MPPRPRTKRTPAMDSDKPIQGKRQRNPTKKLTESAQAAEEPVKKRGCGRPPKLSYVPSGSEHMCGPAVNETLEVYSF